MTTKSDVSNLRRPLRLWPGVVAAVLLVILKVVFPLMGLGAPPPALLGGLAGGLLVVVWWVLFSQAPWTERVGAVAVMAAALYATSRVLHASMSTAGDGMLFYILAIPPMGLAFVVWAVATRSLTDGVRRATMVATILLACGAWTLLRTDGMRGGSSDLRWRWTPTAEARLLAQTAADPVPAAQRPAPEIPKDPVAAAEPVAEPAAANQTPDTAAHETDPADAARTTVPALSEPEIRRVERSEPRIRRVEWTGFRGPNRDGVVRGVSLETEWLQQPPVEVWRRPIGPGWSSFAVQGDFIYTQEQRGEQEMVSAYRLGTGEPVWQHNDAVRFYESNGGPGPRATPTLRAGRVYTLGATGILNALDAATGAVLWSRDAQADSGAPPPGWGFAGSPLVLDDAVIVATSGRLTAYDIATGEPRWTRTTGGGGYSSPHLATIDGVRQVLLLSGGGITSVAPADGATLWQQAGGSNMSIVQPAFTAEADVVVASVDMMGGLGIRRLAVARAGDSWAVEERWTSRGLKPYFNDLVVHGGHAYGFDGSILACIDLRTGERAWKGGRYGQGQILLLADQDLLLVLGEEGQLALVSATPDRYREVTRAPGIEGKTWNHPVLVGDLLLVRNGEEMAAFRLPIVNR